MYKVFVCFILLLDVSFFYLLPIDSISNVLSNYQKLLITIFVVFALVLTFFKTFKNIRYLFFYNILFLGFLYVSEVVLSNISYNQGIKSIIVSSNQYIVLGAYFLISYYVVKKSNIDTLEKIILIFVIALSSIFIIQYLIYKFDGNLFLFIDKNRALMSKRFGEIRIYESTYFNIWGFVLAFGIALKRKSTNKKIAIVACVVSFIQILLVSKNRMGLLIAILSCIYMILINLGKNRYFKYLIGSIIIVAVFGMFKVPVLNNFISTINLKDEGIAIRFEAIEYYINQINSNPFFGTGFIQVKENDDSFNFVRGEKGLFYKDDVGVVGIINTFGIIGLIWYLFLAAKIIKILFNIRNKNKEKNYIEIYGLSLFILGGSAFMNPFDTQRIVLFPFFLALIDVSNKEFLLKDN